jgi:prepilin-type N-terminal cleavage/methylation domain-containing protein/prepilin-type processing-associated H-X9-DG protein
MNTALVSDRLLVYNMMSIRSWGGFAIDETFRMSVCRYKRNFLAGLGGFTLIELLVVISIIAMLMSIMLPSLSSAREMGRRVVCQTNIRSLTIAWSMYSIENNDALCSPDTEGNDYCWVADGPDDPANTIGGTEQAIRDGVLAHYLSYATKAYKCKSDSTSLLRSYAISNTMGGFTCGYGNFTTPYTGLGQIDEPSNRLVFIDADSVLPEGEPKWIRSSFWPVHWSSQAWDIRLYNNMTSRHSDGTNVSYADTHCDYRRWKDQRTIAIGNWDTSAGNMGGNNKDLDYLFEVLKGPKD